MKKAFFSIAVVSFSLLIACNNSTTGTTDADSATADTLMKEVMKGHDVGMAKMQKLSAAQKRTEELLDSIARLPAKAKEATASLKTNLDSLVKDLNYADFAMNKWMSEFNYDSFRNDMKERIRYLTDERLKVGKTKEAILNSLAKADSILIK